MAHAIEIQSHDNHLTNFDHSANPDLKFVATEGLKMTCKVETCRHLIHDHVIAYILMRLYSSAEEINN